MAATYSLPAVGAECIQARSAARFVLSGLCPFDFYVPLHYLMAFVATMAKGALPKSTELGSGVR
jgi:hypothetical protein